SHGSWDGSQGSWGFLAQTRRHIDMRRCCIVTRRNWRKDALPHVVIPKPAPTFGRHAFLPHVVRPKPEATFVRHAFLPHVVIPRPSPTFVRQAFLPHVVSPNPEATVGRHAFLPHVVIPKPEATFGRHALKRKPAIDLHHRAGGEGGLVGGEIDHDRRNLG